MKSKLIIIILIGLVGIFCLASLETAKAESTIYVPDDYSTIQAAVDVANSGDTIIVRDGTYTENVDVNKDHLTIRSENGAEKTIVQSADSNNHVFEVRADYVKIDGFAVKGTTEDQSYSEDFESGFGRWSKVESGATSAVTLVASPEFPVHSGQYSIRQYARDPGNSASIDLPCLTGYSQYSLETWIYVKERTDAYAASLIGFVFAEGHLGWNPWGDDGSYAYPLGNAWSSYYKPVGLPKNSWHHVKVVYYPGDATFSIWVDGQILHDRIKSNAAPGESPLYFTVHAGALNYEGNIIEQYVDDVVVSGPMLGFSAGIYLNNAKHCQISGSNILNNYAGILLESGGATVNNNNILNNQYGIRLWKQSNNIYFNNFINNEVNGYLYGFADSPRRAWGSPEEVTYTYNDNFYTSYLGNYWDDYEGSDGGNDGVGDTPYTPSGYITEEDRDDYPLMEPFENYLLPPENQAPTCEIELRKDGDEIEEVNLRKFFDIYVGGSTDDTGIEEVRFASDESQDGNPPAPDSPSWTKWYDWKFSSEDWEAPTKIKRWSFDTLGDKEIWVEVKDGEGETDKRSANILVYPGYAIIVASQAHDLLSTAQKVFIDHSADFAYQTFHDLGFDNDHIFYLNSWRPLVIDGELVVDDDATKDNFQKYLDEIKDKVGINNPTSFVLFLVGHGGPNTFWLDRALTDNGLRDMLKDTPFDPELIAIWSCDSGSFITTESLGDITFDDSISVEGKNRIIVTAAHDNDTVRFYDLARSSDRFWSNLHTGLNVREAFVRNITDSDKEHRWLDDNGNQKGSPPDNLEADGDGKLAAVTAIGVPGADNLIPWKMALIASPGELRVYDSQNRVTGLVNGEVKQEIPDSIYDEEERVIALFSPLGTYRYEVVGTDEGTYGLEIASIEGAEATTFTATDIPTSANTIHQYSIDWGALFQGEVGVTVQVDSDGDGSFEQSITSDRELTQDEFVIQARMSHWLKEKVKTSLEKAKTGDEEVDQKIDEVLGSLEKSLDDDLWQNENHLDPQRGIKVFQAEAQAVRKMSLYLRLGKQFGNFKWLNPFNLPESVQSAFKQAINDLLKADKMLAEVAIGEAKNTPVQNPRRQKVVDRMIGQAEERMSQAESHSEDRPDRAIIEYGLAWNFGQKAIKFALGP